MQENYPQKPGIDFIVKQAFFYWNKTLIYQLMFSVIYFSIFFTSLFFFATKFGIWEQNQALIEAYKTSTEAYLEKAQALSQTESSRMFMYSFLGTIIFLYPLNLGFFQIYRKMDLNEEIGLSDLFVGYNGSNFFRYGSYFLFWILPYSQLLGTVIFPVFWIAVTLFIAPLMFFQNKTILEGLSLSFKAMKNYFIEIFVCILIAFIFKYIGFGVFFVGALFTFPFWNAMIYSLYKTIFSEKQ
ncbi:MULTISPECIES: hypothetical protein [Chryseobacterium]|uniref:Beta-carotene 15,15'-monooxygenase n=1 Tax=Chryseobacterium taihuense TaxID=1141221 RepID=A0A4U8WG94_9FLAO|nr:MULTISPECIES: hypothetical protein [Chryseobacterium]QQV02723.1 hypothetical protein I6I61_16920 [Chryseobacterium sp. FDAARGOS 1104]VFB04015.1 Uncharacterised protein [Chryseobacterium taihuense]